MSDDQALLVAYRHPKRGQAHALRDPDPQPDPWDQRYSGQTVCGFILRWAFPVPLRVAAPEDCCRLCFRRTLADGVAAGLHDQPHP